MKQRCLDEEALRAIWLEMLGYARREIGCYARWRGQDEPVLANGFDAEGLVQEAFKRVFERGIVVGSEDIRHSLRLAIKHRIRRLHERAETQQVREAAPERVPALQMTMFTPLSQKIVDRIAEVDVDGLTPREALNLLAELQRELKG